MRIALVSDCYLPRLGGIEVQVDALATALRAVGHDVRVLTATPGPQAAGVVRMVPPVPLPAPVNPWAGPGLRAELAAADVVHVHLGVLAPFAGQAVGLALQGGRPTVVTWHSMVGPAVPLLRYAGRWRRWVAGGAVPTAVSTAAAGQVQAVLGAGVPVAVLPNAVDLAAWRPPPNHAEGAVDGTLRVVSAARFARRKRPLHLVRLLLELRRQVPPQIALEAVVAGDGPLRPAAGRAVDRAAADGWLRLPGRLPREELAALYHRSHLYLSPVRLESFGLAALEARAAGLPVAGMAGSGLAEFVTDGRNGLLAADDEALVARTAELLGDRPRLAVMAAYNRHTPPRQVWPAVAAQTLSTYLAAVAGAGRVRQSHHRPARGSTSGM